jgi:hypothetical protein
MATSDQLLAKVLKYHELIFPTLKALKALGMRISSGPRNLLSAGPTGQVA